MGLGGGSGACSWPGRAGDGEGRWKVGVDSGMKRLFEPGLCPGCGISLLFPWETPSPGVMLDFGCIFWVR